MMSRISFIHHLAITIFWFASCVAVTIRMSGSSDYVENIELEAEGKDRNKSASPSSRLHAPRKRGCGDFFSRCFQVKVGPNLDIKEGRHESEDRESSDRRISQSGSTMSAFRSMFHVSADNKLAWKFFGTKNNIVEEQERQQVHHQWVIHPYSSFRYFCSFIV